MEILKQERLLQRVDRLYRKPEERSFSTTTIKLTDLKHHKILEIRTYTPSSPGIIFRTTNFLSLLSLVTVGRIRWVFTLLPLLMKRR